MSEVTRIDDPSTANDDRFARFRLINWWDQELITNARIVVIGAGALGNEIVKNLALLGVGRVFVADRDQIEKSYWVRPCSSSHSRNPIKVPSGRFGGSLNADHV